VPYELLHVFSNMEIIRSTYLLSSAGLIGKVDVSRGVPDHSVLRWSVAVNLAVGPGSRSTGDSSTLYTTITKFDVSEIPDTFLTSEDTLLVLETAIPRLEHASTEQRKIDGLYEEFGTTVRAEMTETFQSKTCVIKSKVNNKKRRAQKPWWNNNQTLLWNDVCRAEREWLKTTRAGKEVKGI
jgi:hypothetical protein